MTDPELRSVSFPVGVSAAEREDKATKVVAWLRQQRLPGVIELRNTIRIESAFKPFSNRA